jgi:hypothetical protein
MIQNEYMVVQFFLNMVHEVPHTTNHAMCFILLKYQNTYIISQDSNTFQVKNKFKYIITLNSTVIRNVCVHLTFGLSRN